MTTLTIRNQLHQIIDLLDENKVEAIYTILKDYRKGFETHQEEYTAEFEAELNRRYEEYKRRGEVITQKEMNGRINEMLKNTKSSHV